MRASLSGVKLALAQCAPFVMSARTPDLTRSARVLRTLPQNSLEYVSAPALVITARKAALKQAHTPRATMALGWRNLE